VARWIPLALFLVALTGVARADEPPVRVLTVGVGALPPPPAEQAGLRAAEVLGQRPIVVEGPLLAVLELHDPIFIPGVQTVPCDGRSVRVDQVVGGLESARRAVDELEYGSARLLLEGGVELLPCLVDVVEPALLYDLHFLSGLVAWNEGDRDQAEASFARAVSVDPARPWDEAYAPDAKGAFLQALQSSIAEPGPILRVSDDLRGRVLLDGRLVADGDHLAAGPHLLQVSTGPTWVSQELQVEPARVLPTRVAILPVIGAIPPGISIALQDALGADCPRALVDDLGADGPRRPANRSAAQLSVAADWREMDEVGHVAAVDFVQGSAPRQPDRGILAITSRKPSSHLSQTRRCPAAPRRCPMQDAPCHSFQIAHFGIWDDEIHRNAAVFRSRHGRWPNVAYGADETFAVISRLVAAGPMCQHVRGEHDEAPPVDESFMLSHFMGPDYELDLRMVDDLDLGVLLLAYEDAENVGPYVPESEDDGGLR